MICQDSLLYVSYPVKSQWQSKLVVYVEHLATGRHIASFDGQIVTGLEAALGLALM